MDQNFAGAIGGCAREKYWHEKSTDEKCLKLGEVVEYLTNEIREMRQEIGALRGHEHSQIGSIMVPYGTDLKNLREESYFFRNPLGREQR